MPDVVYTLISTSSGLPSALKMIADFIVEHEIDVDSFTVEQEGEKDEVRYRFTVTKKAAKGLMSWLTG